MGGHTLEEADNILEKAVETQETEVHLKFLEASREQAIIELLRHVEHWPKEKGEEELKDISEEIQIGKFMAQLLQSKDPEVIDEAYGMAREASEVSSRGQGRVRRLQWMLEFMMDRSEAKSVGEILPHGQVSRPSEPLDLFTGVEAGHQEKYFRSTDGPGVRNRGRPLFVNRFGAVSGTYGILQGQNGAQANDAERP